MRNYIERAWAAGFFDGEGCFNIVKRKSGFRPTLQLAVSQSGSVEELERFQKAVGDVGKIYGPYQPSNPQHKVQWLYRAHGEEARQAYRALKPYLCSVKKAKYAAIEKQCA